MTVKKAPERRQRGKSRNGDRPETGSNVVVLAPNRPNLPAPDPEWHGEVTEAWNDFWSSQLAGSQVLKVTDAPALRRLFVYRDRLLSALTAFDLESIVVGSTGQPTLSPWAAEVHRLEAAVSKLEDKFGLTPMARMKLGISFEEGVSLAHRNAQLLEAFRTSQGG